MLMMQLNTKKNAIDLYRTHLLAAFHFFGQALHPQQDKIAHSGNTGDMRIGTKNFNFHMHWLNDDELTGGYFHPIFQVNTTKEKALIIDTLFMQIVIYSGLINRGINVEKELKSYHN